MGKVASPPPPHSPTHLHPGPACITHWLAESSLKDLSKKQIQVHVRFVAKVQIYKAPLSTNTRISPSVCMLGTLVPCLVMVIGSAFLLAVRLLDKGLLCRSRSRLSSAHSYIVLVCLASAWVSLQQIQVVLRYETKGAYEYSPENVH